MLRFEQVWFRRAEFSLSIDGSILGPGITAVIGPSGAGKSTLISLIAGFEVPTAGQIYWGESPITMMPPDQRPVSVIFQDHNLFPHLNAVTNVALGLSPCANPNDTSREAARSALSIVGLEKLGASLPGELSGGQQSRVALARALVTKKPLILLDEAFSALGPALRTEMLNLLKSVLAERTVLLVTHNPEDALQVSQQTLFLEGGRVWSAIGTDELFARPHKHLKAYLDKGD
ncbi:MAG: ATP-binding cassette domain-containing protein [Aestuariivita sp.]|nr:ATP-binding cassette domain-containing protein [Aestuariivita sp.]MCY4203559.1 ATP-binding cassette domain-containing protein [Aestuariivita sp.]MCY4288895.1 ATP-binding cassette domain-containing protein [Aestuariivita sp.]